MHFATRAVEHRSGLEPDSSGFAVRRLDHFGIQCETDIKLWLGRKDSNLRTLYVERSFKVFSLALSPDQIQRPSSRASRSMP